MNDGSKGMIFLAEGISDILNRVGIVYLVLVSFSVFTILNERNLSSWLVFKLYRKVCIRCPNLRSLLPRFTPTMPKKP